MMENVFSVDRKTNSRKVLNTTQNSYGTMNTIFPFAILTGC